MSSITTLKWASTLATLVLAALFGGLVATAPKPTQAALHPTVKVLPSDTPAETQSHVS
jgi:hypothetical protein